MKIFHCYVKILLGSIQHKSLYNDYDNCAAKTTTTKTSHTYHIQMVDMTKPSHVALPDNAKGRIARHLRVVLWVLQDREIPAIYLYASCINMLLYSVQFKLTTLILNSFSCCLFLNTPNSMVISQGFPNNINDWISTECPGQEAFPSHQTLYTEPEVCNARGLIDRKSVV